MQTIKSILFAAIATLGITSCNYQSQVSGQQPTLQYASVDPQLQSYIGLRYTTTKELKEIEFLGASIFGGGAVKNMQGGYTYVRKGQKNMLWLTGQINVVNQQQPAWKVLDILSFPEYDRLLNNNSYYLGWGGRCRIKNGLSNPDVVAIAVLSKEEWLRDIKQAWKINRETGKFEPYSPNNISCENPNLG
ncbi:hypothetical protein H6G41_07580 [Tolypothrix sp. FACHB-123]|uniref:hypothetical protein n=1 Tax=Tolypothrix sp. FACHB-123 TaxID=2692868 RepID=UPI00168501E1|nr:hypothetical protein [Tolypothrix sp. FACHB-123]MBD2354488.1 hypothetical protein [Tolypothrix sp. FACHB-123]